MKKYIKNKNFISKRFYNEKIKQEEKRTKKIQVLFIILNLILMPISFKNINQYKCNINDYNNNLKQTSNKLNKNSCKNIKIWLENISTDEVESAIITKEDGEIQLNSLDCLNNIYNKGEINIKSLNCNGDTNYILGVELSEKTK